MSTSAMGLLGVAAPSLFSTSCWRKKGDPELTVTTVPGAGWKCDGFGAVGARLINLGCPS